MKNQFIECGQIVSTHGLKGELKVYPWCRDPQELTGFSHLFLDHGKTRVDVQSARVQKGMVFLKISGVATPEEAAALRGRILYLDRSQERLEEGEYYIQDLIGIEVYDADNGVCYGNLCDVTSTGANDVYHIRFADGRVRLVPAIRQVVLKTDVDNNRMEIRPMEGLFDE